MPPPPSSPRRRTRPGRGVVIVALLLITVLGPAGGAGASAHEPVADVSLAARGWIWPFPAARITRAYLAPAHEYAPGHRGIDLEALVTDSIDGADAVLAPASGVVAFAGEVAGRPLITVDHRGGLVTTLEPVQTSLLPGSTVEQGTPVGVLASGGHAMAGTLHFGVRLDGEYINPLLLLDGVPRAVLLPCCGPLP